MMRYVKVALPDELEEGARRKAGSLFGARKGSFSRSVTSALVSWLQPDPDLHVGMTAGGMCFEVPERLAPRLLAILVEELRPTRVTFSYLEGEEEAVLACPPGEAVSKIGGLGSHILDSSFMAEFDEAELYTGGGGCISLRAELTGEQKRRIALRLLDEAGLKVKLDKGEFSVTVRGDLVEVS